MTFIKANYRKNLPFQIFTYLFLMGNLIAFTACATPSQKRVPVQDTISPSKKAYQGYRLQITNIKVTKSKGNQRKIKCTLINTGRNRIRLPINNLSSKNLIVKFDKSLEDNDLAGYEHSIEDALLKEKFSLDVGKIASNFEFRFNISEKSRTKKEEVVKKDAKTSVKKEQPISEPVYDPSLCADLQIDTVFVMKRTKKTVELAFKITNYGEGPAAMFGPTESSEDNVAIRAYASGTAKLSRGDLVLGGAFIEGGLEDKNGILKPQESFSGSFTVASRKKTRYMPYFILSIDDYQALWECDERNNVFSLLDRR